jgi:NAD(P)-dependent dehydrogenase (short-subunit alcohol dehydrogenase family)
MNDHEQMAQGRPAALVTGGAIRLGKAIALALAGAGFDIALHYHSSAAPARAAADEIRRLGVYCEPFRLDLSDVAAIPAFMEQVRRRFPGLSLLVNSASAYTQATLQETSAEVFDTQFAVNLRAPFFLTQAFARPGIEGQVINILDNKIAFNQFQYAAYLLSKKALAELTRLAAVELAPSIRVNAVAPGVVLPAGTRSQEYIDWRVQGIPLRFQGETDHIAQAILYLVRNTFVTGQILLVDGGESLTQVGQNAADFDQSKV